ncbi:Outer membrane protein beta-barrel domain-containing protein [Filimonas lacunae]|uniref:Outer membrane protein beta-barrel domain-containing protein n=1 Tax=Filimonas lacunae TaxID=477680 RepID=A0A173MLE6_9BACT|nr:porin family protein [Filimonas lacunae]BAV08452.1 hypothetical protein FLA_4493 [Filimonas lacunae]SIT33957.1 Outer membrane protein beta-barrel domain-containing protein [Filimonas lacunae]
MKTYKQRVLSFTFSVFAVTMLAIAGNAQGFHLGAKAGANLGKLDGVRFKDGYELGFHLGGFAEIDFNKTIGIQPELLFNQTNTKVTNQTSDIFKPGDNIHLNYLSIPILLRINAGKLLTLNAGPQYSILLNNHKTTLQNAGDAFKSGDFALAFGAQVNLSALRIYGRYNIGLSDVGDVASQDKWKNQQLQLGVGLRIL